MKKLFCCPALELFCCLPLWKTVLFVSSRAFSLSIPTFLLSTPVENSEATRKKLQNATNSNVVCVWAIKPANHCNLRYFSELSLFDDSFALLKTHSDGFLFISFLFLPPFPWCAILIHRTMSLS